MHNEIMLQFNSCVPS